MARPDGRIRAAAGPGQHRRAGRQHLHPLPDRADPGLRRGPGVSALPCHAIATQYSARVPSSRVVEATSSASSGSRHPLVLPGSPTSAPSLPQHGTRWNAAPARAEAAPIVLHAGRVQRVADVVVVPVFLVRLDRRGEIGQMGWVRDLDDRLRDGAAPGHGTPAVVGVPADAGRAAGAGDDHLVLYRLSLASALWTLVPAVGASLWMAFVAGYVYREKVAGSGRPARLRSLRAAVPEATA